MRLLTLPNLLSLTRLPLAAAFLLVESTAGRIAIVCAVAITDLADGFAARRIRSHDRRAGQLIDPVTDKLFVLLALGAFVLKRELSPGEFLVALTRDIYNSVAFLIGKIRSWPIDFRARASGKIVTILQLALLLALLFWPAVVRPLLWVIAAASVIAIVDYTATGQRKRRLAGM